MAVDNHIGLAVDMAVQAWEGDADAMEILRRAGRTFGQKIDMAQLGELTVSGSPAATPWCCEPAWGRSRMGNPALTSTD